MLFVGMPSLPLRNKMRHKQDAQNQPADQQQATSQTQQQPYTTQTPEQLQRWSRRSRCIPIRWSLRFSRRPRFPIRWWKPTAG